LVPIVIIADDHPLFRDALQQAIENSIKSCQFVSAGSLDELRTLMRQMEPIEMVMLDLTMPGASGFSGLMSIRAEFPEIPLVVVSANENPSTIRKCIDLGASGFIPKSSGTEFILDAVHTIQAGEIWLPDGINLEDETSSEANDLIQKVQSLTPQQMRVLSMLTEGLLNKQIAYELGVSEATVKAHVSAVLLKLGVDSRTQAVITMNKISSDLSDIS